MMDDLKDSSTTSMKEVSESVCDVGVVACARDAEICCGERTLLRVVNITT